MTKKFDDKARSDLQNQLFTYSFDSEWCKPKNMIIKEITVKEARGYIATYHYSKSMPDSTMFCFAWFYGEALAWIIVYGMWAGKSQYKALLPNIKQWEYVELTRLWSPDWMPKNTESKLIWWSLKLLPSKIKLVISFADPSKNHKWTIYQATNFYYCGMTSWWKCLITKDWYTQHTRLIWIYKLRHPELKEKTTREIMDIYEWTYWKNYWKHRYVYLLWSKTNKKHNKKYLDKQIKIYPN